MNEEEPFRIKIEGASFNANGTSLHELIKVYSAIEGLFDSSYANIAGYEKLSKSTRGSYQILINEAKIGSWESFLKIAIAVSPALFSQGLTPKDYLETIFTTYEFLKTLFTLRKIDSAIKVISEGNGNKVTISSGNTVSYVFNAPVTINLVENAQKCLPDFKQLTDQIKTGNISSLSIDSPTSSKRIFLSTEDANLFDIAETTSEDTKNVFGEIYRFNKRSRTGKIHITDSEDIIPGKYTFSVKNKEIQSEVIMSMLKNDGSFSVREVFIEDPISGNQIIHSLELVDL